MNRTDFPPAPGAKPVRFKVEVFLDCAIGSRFGDGTHVIVETRTRAGGGITDRHCHEHTITSTSPDASQPSNAGSTTAPQDRPTIAGNSLTSQSSRCCDARLQTGNRAVSSVFARPRHGDYQE